MIVFRIRPEIEGLTGKASATPDYENTTPTGSPVFSMSCVIFPEEVPHRLTQSGRISSSGMTFPRMKYLQSL